MYQKLAENLAVGTATDQYSPAVSMEGANVVQVELILISLGAGATAVSANVQISNDLENWTDLTGVTGQVLQTGVGYSTATIPTDYGSQRTRISGAFVRIRYDATGGTVILAAGINTSSA